MQRYFMTWAKMLSLFAVILAFNPGWASTNSIGEVYLIQGEVQALSSSGQIRRLTSKSPIYQGDTIKTIGEGAVVFNLIDGTQWEMLDDSEMRIKNYQFSAHASHNDGAEYDLKQGNIRYISGELGERQAKTLIHTPDGKTLEPQGTEIVFSMVYRITVIRIVSGSARMQTMVIGSAEYVVMVNGQTQTFSEPQAALDAFNQAVAATQQQGEQVTNVQASARIVNQANIVLVSDSGITVAVTQAEMQLNVTVTTEPRDLPASPN